MKIYFYVAIMILNNQQMKDKILREEYHELNKNIPNLWAAAKIVLRGEILVLKAGRGCSMVKSTSCSCSIPKFDFQHPY